MDIQLNGLIEKIKTEGVESAKSEAAAIKSAAEVEAAALLADAKAAAAIIIADANAEAEQSRKIGRAALEQAGRDLIIAFRGAIQDFLNRLAAETVASSYSAEVIKDVLPELIKHWATKDTDSLTVLLAEEDLARLDDAFKAVLYSALKGGVEIKAVKNLDSGFHIVEKDGSAYYDFSAQAVADMLSVYLNPKLATLLTRMEDSGGGYT